MHWFLVLIFLVQLPVFASDPSEVQVDLQPGMTNPGFEEKPAWFKQSFLDIRDDVQEATDSDKRVMLYFYQDGCPYCKKLLEVNLADRELSQRIRKGLDVIAINMWGDQEVTGFSGDSVTEKFFAANMKVMFTPTLLFLNEQGSVVMRLNGYYPPYKFGAVVDYVANQQEKEITFPEYWEKIAPPATMGVLHHHKQYIQPPYDLSDYSLKKPLLVLFEQKDCAHCDELHLDIFNRHASLPMLSGYDILLLDMWSDTPLQTPEGKHTTARAWAKQLGIQYAPTLVMIDQGKEVFRTEAYLKAFHIQSSLDYVLSGAYKEQPSFQRFIAARADALEAQGIHVDMME